MVPNVCVTDSQGGRLCHVEGSRTIQKLVAIVSLKTLRHCFCCDFTHLFQLFPDRTQPWLVAHHMDQETNGKGR